MTEHTAQNTNDDPTTSLEHQAPEACVTPARRGPWWVWAIPLIALGLAIYLTVAQWGHRGPTISITFEQGHGIKTGDLLRCRGIVVGQIESVVLNNEMDGIIVKALLTPEARDVTTPGTRFWIVHPQISITAVRGLETITGPNYIAVLPGSVDKHDDGDDSGDDQNEEGTKDDKAPKKPLKRPVPYAHEMRPLKQFVGLEQPPVMAGEEPGGVDIALYGGRRGGLAAGAPITYRQFRVGTIVSVGLASDAGSVEVRAYIRPAFKQLVRDNTRFWLTGGADWSLGWSGVRVNVESMATLLDGGVAMATPENAGVAVSTGHRFQLFDKPEDEWVRWTPTLTVGSPSLPAGRVRPNMLRATATRIIDGRLWDTTNHHAGWLLPIEGGVVGPEELLVAKGVMHGRESSATLELLGQKIDLQDGVKWRRDGLAMRSLVTQQPTWPADRLRTPGKPESCFLFADGTTPPKPIDASRLAQDGDHWDIDRSISFDEVWHGAAVVARSDGRVIGLLRVERGRGIIALWADVTDTAESK